MHDTAVLDRTQAPKNRIIGKDNSECPGYGTVCPEWHDHKHCALCSFILVAQSDGCGSLEGYGPDANAVECDECERYSCPECTRSRKGKTLCYDCFMRPYIAPEAKVEEANIVVNNMLDAARDLKLAGQRLARETDPEQIASAVAALVDVQREASFCASVVAWVRVRAAA